MTSILGLSAYYAVASAALVSVGRLIAAVEEVRFLGVKYWAGFSERALRWCGREALRGLTAVDFFAVTHRPQAYLAARRAVRESYGWDRIEREIRSVYSARDGRSGGATSSPGGIAPAG